MKINMQLNTLALCAAAAAAALLMAPDSGAATLTSVGTTGVFDENTQTINSIDLDPTGNLAAFKSAVATAYANNLGGVIDWEAGVNANASSTSPGDTFASGATISASYGVSAANLLQFTFDRDIALYSNNVANQVNVLSSDPNAAHGNNAILPNATGGSGDQFLITFSSANVAEVGLGMLARSTYFSNVGFRATATYSDSSTAIINYTLGPTLGDGAGSSDTFLHFAAAPGLTISSVYIETTNLGSSNTAQARPILDDFGFILVPEPSSLALLGLGGLLIARRRRA